jgi:hypothetical protein
VTEKELRAVPEFVTLPVASGDAAAALFRPVGPGFTGTVYDAVDVSQVRDFLRDPALVPIGACRDDDGNLRAVFWQVRTVR